MSDRCPDLDVDRNSPPNGEYRLMRPAGTLVENTVCGTVNSAARAPRVLTTLRRDVVALSEREQQLLAQLEQQLNADDPQFASQMESRPVRPTFSTRAIVLGAVIAVVGLGVVIGGVMLNQILIGVAGFLIMSLGVFWASTRGSGKPKDQTQTEASPSSGPKPKATKPSSGFMRNLEDKWDERRSSGQ